MDLTLLTSLRDNTPGAALLHLGLGFGRGCLCVCYCGEMYSFTKLHRHRANNGRIIRLLVPSLNVYDRDLYS